MPFKLEFDPGAIISFALLYVVSSVEVLGDTAALTKVGLDRQPTDKETAGAIAGDGLISSALSLTIGIGFTQVGDIFANFPALFQSIFASNCIAVSFVVAVILNAVLPSEEHFLSAPQHQEA